MDVIEENYEDPRVVEIVRKSKIAATIKDIGSSPPVMKVIQSYNRNRSAYNFFYKKGDRLSSSIIMDECIATKYVLNFILN